MSARRRAVGVLAVVVAGCTVGDATTTSSSALGVPVNVCPDNPCSAYVQAGATPDCNGGQCLVTAGFTNLFLVVQMATDSYYAPGQTFAMTYPEPGTLAAGQKCASTPCYRLPPNVAVQGYYEVAPQDQLDLNWDLGNKGSDTLLPVQVTYRPLWPTTAVSSTSVEARTLGFPVYDIASIVFQGTINGFPPGPNGNPSPLFQATFPAGAYEVTIQPQAPFDAAFPPYVRNIVIGSGNFSEQVPMVVDDTNREPDGPKPPIIPQFIVERTTTLAGWTAYLRDVTTLERISSAPTLTAAANTVTLATNHAPSDGDALTNAELVVQPPAGSASPAYVVAVTGNVLSYSETVPDLPPAVTVSGALTDVDGVTPLEGDLVFEVHPGASSQQGLYVAGATTALNTSNFDLVVRTHASAAAAGGPSSYSVLLPPGQYQLTVIPADTAHAVTVQPAFLVPVQAAPLVQAVPAGLLRTVQGKAALADGRPLAGAVVDVVPTACAQATGAACMPRGAQTTTAADGSFTLSLDPGTYALAVEPAQGSRFPWATQTLLVGPTDVLVPPVLVPAPAYGGLTLHDPADNPVVDAIIRVLELPKTGPAVEVGRTITDASGHYDMYLAPSAQ